MRTFMPWWGDILDCLGRITRVWRATWTRCHVAPPTLVRRHSHAGIEIGSTERSRSTAADGLFTTVVPYIGAAVRSAFGP